MILDIPTLFASYVLCALTMLVLLLVSYRHERPKSVGLWMLWLALQVPGLALYALRDRISPWLSIVLANVLITGALSCALAALQNFFQRPLRPGLMAFPVLAAAAITSLGLEHPLPRIQAINSLLAFQCLLLAVAVLRARPRGDLTSLLVGVPFLVNAVAIVLRAFTIATEPGYHLLASNAPQTATFLLLLVTLLGSTFGFVLMHRERAEAEIKTLALHDPLTGCLNRRSFELIMEKEVARLGRGGAQLSLLFMDIDHFKQVNDTYGHAAGDAVLVDLVHRTERVLRSQDFIFRYGGEEFCIILPRSGRADALAIAERIRQTIEAGETVYGGQHIRYTVSIGVTRSEGVDTDQRVRLLGEADRAMYAAKQQGRNRVVHYDDLGEDLGRAESQTS